MRVAYSFRQIGYPSLVSTYRLKSLDLSSFWNSLILLWTFWLIKLECAARSGSRLYPTQIMEIIRFFFLFSLKDYVSLYFFALSSKSSKTPIISFLERFLCVLSKSSSYRSSIWRSNAILAFSSAPSKSKSLHLVLTKTTPNESVTLFFWQIKLNYWRVLLVTISNWASVAFI